MASSIEELSAYRFERARTELQNAEDLHDDGKYNLSLNRSYYSIFYAIRAVNVLDAFDSSRHSGVIAHFNEHYVKTGDFSRESSKIIKSAYNLREHADYKDFFLASRQQAEEQVRNAEKFLSNVAVYLKDKGIIG